jgi:hypothetical protein
MLSVIKLSVSMSNVVILSVIMQNGKNKSYSSSLSSPSMDGFKPRTCDIGDVTPTLLHPSQILKPNCN